MKVEVRPGLDTGRCDGAETVFDVLVAGKGAGLGRVCAAAMDKKGAL